MSDLVIGEGVALDLRLAKVPSRALAKLLDLLVQFGAAIVLGIVLAALSVGTDQAVAVTIYLIFTILLIIGYPVLFESLLRGRTPGKMALGLRVVRTDGGPIRFRHALVRALTGIFDFIVTVGMLAVVTSFCSRNGRRTGDFLAGTVVVRDRTPDSGVSAAGMQALAMPHPLFAWAQSLDLSLLPDDLALAARQYLTRLYELRPEVAARMGYDLMVEVAQYVPQPPPYGTPPWAYLAGITAERRARQMRKAEEERRAAWERQQQAHTQFTLAYTQQQRVAPYQPYPPQQQAPQGDAVPAPGQDPQGTTKPVPTPAGSDGDTGFKPPA